MIRLIIILLYLSKEAFDAIIDILDMRWAKGELPENVRDVYNAEEYRNWRAYRKECGRTHALSGGINIAVTLILLVTNAYAGIFDLFPGRNIYLQYLAFVAVTSLISIAVETPVSYYETFVTEEKYGLNRSTKKTFWLDTLKSTLLGIAVSYGFVVLVMILFERFGNLAIIWCSAVVLGVSMIIMLIVVPLMRIYNRFEPLGDGKLKEELLALCDRYGVRVRKIVVRDASRRTATANAFCTGLGNRKTISLDDNLVNEYSPEEITAVFAHEFAHAKFHHSAKSLPFSIFDIAVVFTALAIVLNIPQLYTAFGFAGINYGFAIMLTDVVMWPVSTLLEIAGNALSRRHEYQADAFAAEDGYGKELIAALKRLTKESLSAINPHPARVILSYSHPTLSQRIEAIEKVSAGL